MIRENRLENIDFGLDSIGKLFKREDISYLRQFKSYSEKIRKTKKELKFGGKKWKKERQ